MKRRTQLETDLDAYATSHDWPALFARHGADQAAVMAQLRTLLGALPARRRVRALELALLLEAHLDRSPADERAVSEAIVESLRTDYHHAFRVAGGARPAGTAKPVLITTSPGSGGPLLQRMVADLTGFPTLAASTVADLDPDSVAGPALIHVHAPNDRQARKFVAATDAEVITVARHPFDVLLSAAHASHLEHTALDWLDGAVIPSPEALRGASPTSEQFLTWATDKGAARLLDITRRWWRDGTTHRVRYEDLIADPPGAIGKLLAGLGIAPDLAETHADHLRALAGGEQGDPHRWRNVPNGWRDLLPVETATRVHRAHRRAFLDLDYTLLAADPLLDEITAASNWRALTS